jgi:hypothetical protein
VSAHMQNIFSVWAHSGQVNILLAGLPCGPTFRIYSVGGPMNKSGQKVDLYWVEL